MLLAALMALAVQAPAAAAPAGSSAATGTLATFKSLCVASQAKSDPAIKAAEALGWTVPSAAMMADLPSTMQGMKNINVRMSGPAKGVYLVITGNDADILGAGVPVRNDTCMVMTINIGATDSNLKADTVSWMGAEPSGSQGPLTIYGYTEKAGVRTILKQEQDQEAKQAFASGKLHIVALASQDPVNIMIYVVPNQAN